MKLKLFLIYFIGLFFIDPVVYAEVAPGYTHTEKVTCGTSGVECGPQGDLCSQGSYCSQAECQKCDDNWPVSDPASFGQDSCYKNCGIKENVLNGYTEPDFNIACYDNECTYDQYYVVCNNEDDECNGYHAEGEGEDEELVGFVPVDGELEKVFLFDKDILKVMIKDENPMYRLSDIINKCCPGVCDLYSPDYEHCTIKNKMCLLRGLFIKESFKGNNNK